MRHQRILVKANLACPLQLKQHIFRVHIFQSTLPSQKCWI